MFGASKMIKLLVCAASLALSLAIPASAQDNLKLKMVFSITPSTPVLPYLVAKDSGWYAKNGLDIEELTILGDANALRAVISGSGDVAQFGLTTALQAVAESGVNIKLIGSWQPVVDYQFIAATKGLTNPINSLEDFKGKIFASASPGDLTFEIPKMVFKKHNIDTSGMTFIAVGPHPDRLKAVMAGKAQVSMVNLLTAERGVQDGAVKIISAVKDDFPDFGFSYLVTSGKNLADPEKKKAMAILVKGGIYGARLIMEHPDEAAKILHNRIPDMSVDLIKPVLVDLNKLKVWGYNGGLDSKAVQFTSDLSVEYKQMVKPVSASAIIDTEFTDKAVAELGAKQ
jgi:NitT/TauT family transport system substrate-binding protein